MPPLVLMKKDWFRSLFSRFAVETVHNCDCFSEVWSEFHRCISARCVQRDFPVFLISLVLLKGWAIRVVFLCQFVPLSSQFWDANHDILNLVGSDREFHQISFWYISSARCGPRNALSVPQFCRAEHHEVDPSWWRSAGLREHPVAIGEDVGWIYCLARDVHKWNKPFLDSNKEGILSVALFGMVPHNSNNSSLPISRIITFWFFTEWVVGVILLQIGLKCSSMRMTLRPMPSRKSSPRESSPQRAHACEQTSVELVVLPQISCVTSGVMVKWTRVTWDPDTKPTRMKWCSLKILGHLRELAPRQRKCSP